MERIAQKARDRAASREAEEAAAAAAAQQRRDREAAAAKDRRDRQDAACREADAMEFQAYDMLSQEADASREATLGDLYASYLATVDEASTYDDLSGAGDDELGETGCICVQSEITKIKGFS